MRYADARSEVGARSHDRWSSGATDGLFLAIFTGAAPGGAAESESDGKASLPFLGKWGS